MWKPHYAVHYCGFCRAERPFTEGKCDYCASMAPAVGRVASSSPPAASAPFVAPYGPPDPELRYTARRTSSGEGCVLAPDGLTWVVWLRELAAAERYADRLNAWLESFPMPDELVPITDSFTPPPAPTITDELVARLERICEKLAGPDNVRLPLEGSDLWTSS